MTVNERQAIILQGIGGALLGISVVITNNIVQKHEARLNRLTVDMWTIEEKVRRLDLKK